VKAAGHPVGLGISNSTTDASATLLSLLHAYGSGLQDGGGNVALNRPETVEAVKTMTAIYRAGMTEDVLTWDSSSNNRYLAEGRGSLIVNAVSALRAIEAQDPGLAAKVQLLPTPEGPAGRHSVYGTGTYVIWKFARNQEAAKQFLLDLAVDYQQAFERSGFYNLPSFPGAVADLPGLLDRESKYSLLADAAGWSTNLGHPGYANAAIDEVLTQFIIPRDVRRRGPGGDERRGCGASGRGPDEADLREVAGAGKDLRARGPHSCLWPSITALGRLPGC
jgi:multiple sugar transport system substrate-binding protein